MSARTAPFSDVTLVLFLKAPHNAKRRLAGEIGDQAGTTAAGLLWRCVLEDVRKWEGPVWFSPAGPEDEAWLTSRMDGGMNLVRQRGANLGERINHVDRELRSKGMTKILFLGTDCPALDSDYLHCAAAELARHDAVLGPARDGGVVLMGARLAWPELRHLPWSTDRLHRGLAALCHEAGWTNACLETRSDIDTVSDLLAVPRELVEDPRGTRRELVRWIVSRTSSDE